MAQRLLACAGAGALAAALRVAERKCRSKFGLYIASQSDEAGEEEEEEDGDGDGDGGDGEGGGEGDGGDGGEGEGEGGDEGAAGESFGLEESAIAEAIAEESGGVFNSSEAGGEDAGALGGIKRTREGK